MTPRRSRQCAIVLENCVRFSSPTVCTLCEREYYLEQGGCLRIKVPIPGCLEYQQEGACVKCNTTNFYKENNTEGQTILGRKLRKWCDEQGLKHVAMLWVPSPVDAKTCGLYKVNPEAKNTVFVYKKRTVVAKWVNMEYNNELIKELLKKIDAGSL